MRQLPYAAGRYQRSGMLGLPLFLHDDAVADVVVFHARHKGAHQHDPAAGRDFQAIWRGGIGHLLGIKARALVLNLHPEARGRKLALYMNGLFLSERFP